MRGEARGKRPHPIPLLRAAWRRGGRRRGRGAQRGPHPRAGRHSWEAGALTWTPGPRARQGGSTAQELLKPPARARSAFPEHRSAPEGDRALTGQPSSSAQEAREPRQPERKRSFRERSVPLRQSPDSTRSLTPGPTSPTPCRARMMNNSNYSDASGLGLADEADEMPSTEKDLAEDAPWKKIQQNTFTRWCNEHLKCVGKRLNDLQRDLSDGLRLIALLEVLSQKRMYRKFHPRPNFRQMKLENVSVALEFLEREHIKLVSIGQCGRQGTSTAGVGRGDTGAGTGSRETERLQIEDPGWVSPSLAQAAALTSL